MDYGKKVVFLQHQSAIADMTSPIRDTPVSSPFLAAPMLRLALALALGLVLSTFVALPLWVFSSLIAVMLLLMWWVYRSKGSHFVFLSALWVVYLCLGFLLAAFHSPANPFAHSSPQPWDKYQVRCTVRSVSQAPRTFKVEADLCQISSQPAQGVLMLYVAKDSLAASLQPGMHLVAIISPRPTFDSAAENDYGRSLARKGILWQSYVPTDKWQIDTASVYPPPTMAQHLRLYAHARQQQLVARIRQSRLTNVQRSMAEAMLLGWRQDLSPQTRQQFAASGIAHLLCVSGLHVGIVAMLVGWFLFFLGQLRWQRILRAAVQIVAIWCYVLLTGMAPATLRAGVMLSIMLLGTMLSRQTHSLNNLATSVLLMLLIKPSLLWDVGFQLSVSAVLGIVLLYNPLRHLIPALSSSSERSPWLFLPSKLWSWLTLSTAAQLGSLPFTLYYFHQFPTYFLVSNMLIVPFAGILLATMVLALLASGWCWLSVCLQWELQMVDSLTRWVSSLPGALPSHIYFSLPMAVILALALLCVSGALRSKYYDRNEKSTLF